MEGLMPTQEELATLGIGSFVKIERKGKKFWVEVTKKAGDIITGIIDSEDIPGVKAGQMVAFTKENIKTIFY